MSSRCTSYLLTLAGFCFTGCIAFGQPATEPKPAPEPKPAAKAEEGKGQESKDDKKKDDSKPAAQPEEETGATPEAKFQAVRERWIANDKRLNEIAEKYNGVPEAERAVLKAEYTQLAEELQKMLPKLREAALAAFEAAPNKNADVVLTLAGMVAHHVRRDEHEEALKLGKTLIDGKCEEPLVYGLAGTAAYRMDDYESAEKYLTVADKAGRLDPEGQSYLRELPEQKKAWEKELAIREKEKKADDLPRVKLETSKGTIVIELFENEAPGAVGNFISLVEKKFYDGLTFHRVLPNFMAQGGDPTGDGTGGPGYQIYCECEKADARKHFRGSLSMAHAGKDTGGSQFFMTFVPTTNLNGRHTVFGRVIEGLDVLAKLQRRDPQSRTPPQPDRIVKAEVIRKREHAYKPNKVE